MASRCNDMLGVIQRRDPRRERCAGGDRLIEQIVMVVNWNGPGARARLHLSSEHHPLLAPSRACIDLEAEAEYINTQGQWSRAHCKLDKTRVTP